MKLRVVISYARLFQFALCCCAALLLTFPLATAGKKKLPAHPIDLNTATMSQLEELPGVGPVTAQKIMEFREKSGPFKSVNDLLAVPRISKRKLDKMRPYITIGPPAKKQ
ncbi:MAG: helix-hairpin-helix domain-containing protein [Candidatus Acidiferrales bacterium]